MLHYIIYYTEYLIDITSVNSLKGIIFFCSKNCGGWVDNNRLRSPSSGGASEHAGIYRGRGTCEMGGGHHTR
jgi:hypothetical protein